MFIPLKTPLPAGTKVCFEFPIKGKCPEGGKYSGTCRVGYHPFDKLVNIAGFQQKFTKSTLYAELHALLIYSTLGAMLKPHGYVEVWLDITKSEDHGPLTIILKGIPK